MGKKKFEVGMRVRGAEIAPARFKGRTGTIKDHRPYEGYGVEFDDNPDAIERLAPNRIEVLTLSTPRVLSSTPQNLEKRRSERYQADCFVALEFHGHRLIGRCVDYSESGFGAIVDRHLPIGWAISVELPITDRKPLRLQARVVYQKDSRYGFEFETQNENEKRLIGDFFRKSL